MIYNLDKITELKLKRMAELYRKGTLSLQEAANAAHVSIYEMMDYLEQEKITPWDPSKNQLEDQFQTSQKILNSIIPQK